MFLSALIPAAATKRHLKQDEQSEWIVVRHRRLWQDTRELNGPNDALPQRNCGRISRPSPLSWMFDKER
jgi:hypothetical protein